MLEFLKRFELPLGLTLAFCLTIYVVSEACK